MACTTVECLIIDHGTISTDVKSLDIAAGWNAGAVAFTAVRLNITDTASAAGSLLIDLQVGGISRFSIDKTGSVQMRVGPHGIGAAPSSNRQLMLAGTFTGVTEAEVIGIETTVVPGANNSAHGMEFNTKFQKAASGEHRLITPLWVRSPSTLDHGPNILPGAATIGSVAGIYLSGRPSGATNNYAIWLEDGNLRLGGGIATCEGTAGGAIVVGGVKAIVQRLAAIIGALEIKIVTLEVENADLRRLVTAPAPGSQGEKA